MSLKDLVGNLARRRFAQEFSWIAVGQVVTVVMRLVGIRILTELVEPQVFGVVGLTIGLGMLARNTLCAPILEASWRFYADAVGEDRIADHRALLAHLLRTRTAMAVSALVLGAMAWSAWEGTPETAWNFAAVSVLAALETLRTFELGLLNAARRQQQHAGWTLLDEVLRLTCAIGGVLLFGPHAVVVLAGYALGVALGTGVFWRARVRGGNLREDVEWTEHRRSEVVRYALPLSLLAIVGWTFHFSDRYVLAALASTEATGIYIAAYGLASQPFMMASSILGLTIRPIYNDAVVRLDHRRERRVFLAWLLLLASVLLPGLVLLTWLAEPLTGLLLAAQYSDAAALLPWIGAAYALQGCKQVFESVIHAQKRTMRLVVAQGCAALVSLSLYVLLIPELGGRGAAIGTLAGMGVALLMVIILSGAFGRLIQGHAGDDSPTDESSDHRI